MEYILYFYLFPRNPISLTEPYCLSRFAYGRCCLFQRSLIKNNTPAADDTSLHYHERTHQSLFSNQSHRGMRKRTSTPNARSPVAENSPQQLHFERQFFFSGWRWIFTETVSVSIPGLCGLTSHGSRIIRLANVRQKAFPICLFHGYHKQSASFTDNEGEGATKVRMW